ncbi:MAG: GIY-YIG nuclease family protein [Mycoplasmoidaceae bacterium]
MNNKNGVIYILTNPSFPKYVKIGYADDIEKRLKQLNRSDCIPYAFRPYACYKVSTRLSDKQLHNMIDRINPNLRSIDHFNGKKRIREFYEMDAQAAYKILEAIAGINNLEDNLYLFDSNESKPKDNSPNINKSKRVSRKFPKMDWMIEQGLINIGEKIYVVTNPDEKAVIFDKNLIEYKEKKCH